MGNQNSTATPAEQAYEDWNAGTASYMQAGDIYSDFPLIHDRGLYVTTGCDSEFAREYNSTIADLIRDNGLPPWAPGARLPDSHEARDFMSSAEPIESFDSDDLGERQVFAVIRNDWTNRYGLGPDEFVRLKEREVILLGSANESVRRIDAIDTLQCLWMFVYIGDDG